MVKNPKAPYQTKRSTDWLKFKPSDSFDLEVVAVEPGTPGTKFEKTMGAVLFEGVHNGQRISVSVGSGWSEADRDEVWRNRKKIVGFVGEIEADTMTQNQHAQDTWSLRFPRFVRWRGQAPGEKM